MDNAPLLAIAEPLIKGFESCRLKAYWDPIGKVWTIGWGRADPGVHEGMTCTQAEADAWFDAKVDRVIAGIDDEHPWWRTLNLPRQAVLVSMAYQMGEAGLDGFPHALGYMQAGKFDLAADAMRMSAWDRVQTPGRAEREAEIMESGAIA